MRGIRVRVATGLPSIREIPVVTKRAVARSDRACDLSQMVEDLDTAQKMEIYCPALQSGLLFPIVGLLGVVLCNLTII